MAGPVSQIGQNVIPVGHVSFASTPVLSGIANATIRPGDIIVRSLTSGKVALAAADATTTALGVAMNAGTAAAATEIRFVPFWNGVLFSAILDNSTTTGHALVATNVLDSFGINVDAGNLNYYIDVLELTATLFVVTKLIDPVGTVRGRVQVTPIQNKTAWSL